MAHTLESLAARHPEKISGWYRDPDGYWIDLQYGWQFGGVHTVHEHLVRDVVASFRAVEPCDCLSCRTQGAQWEDYDIDTGAMVVRERKATEG